MITKNNYIVYLRVERGYYAWKEEEKKRIRWGKKYPEFFFSTHCLINRYLFVYLLFNKRSRKKEEKKENRITYILFSNYS